MEYKYNLLLVSEKKSKSQYMYTPLETIDILVIWYSLIFSKHFFPSCHKNDNLPLHRYFHNTPRFLFLILLEVRACSVNEVVPYDHFNLILQQA